jgi:hypothetical protein
VGLCQGVVDCNNSPSTSNTRKDQNMMIPAYKIAQLAEKHTEALKALGFELATNFDVPAPRLINLTLSRIGIDRVTYERIIAYQNNNEYTPIPKHLLHRWAAC